MLVKIVCLVLFIMMGFISPLEARQDTGGKFLTFGISARATGMGEAFVAIADDPATIHFNPAGLGFIREKQIMAMRNALYQDIVEGMYHNFFSYIYPQLQNHTTWAVSLNLLEAGSHPITQYDESLQESKITGEFHASDQAVIVSSSYLINKGLAVGMNLKGVYSKFYTIKATAYALDAGVLYKTPIENLNIGLSLKDWGSKIWYKDKYQADQLPTSLKLGTAYKLSLKDDRIPSMILVAFDFNKPFYDKHIGINTGLEWSLLDINGERALIGRAGYFDKGKELKGATYGYGIKLKNWQIDFANLPAGGLGRNSNFSVIKKF